MLKQGFGQIYSLEGLGSDGRWVAGLSLYGTTKYGLKYLNDALVKETKGTPIIRRFAPWHGGYRLDHRSLSRQAGGMAAD